MSKVYVNIYNEGKIIGIKTPVYNYPLDFGVYQFLREIGVQIELTQKNKEDNIIETIKKEYNAPEITITENEPKEQVKDSYTEEELQILTKAQLIDILHQRGHYSNKTGKRDSLAPKRDDNKTILISKVLETNKND